mgnify:CR=1 FL=1
MPASAQVAVDWQVTGSASVGVTDNVANTPEPPEDAGPDVIGPQPDGFGSLSPAFEVTFETARATQSLGWAFGYNFYFTHPEANTISNGLSYGLTSEVAPGTTLTFGVSGSQTNLANFNLLPASGQTAVVANEGGDNLIFTVGVGQGLSAQVAETLVFSQGLSASYAHTFIDEAEDTKTYIAGASLGLTKQFEVDSLTWALGTDTQITPEQVTEVGLLPALYEIFHRFDMNWNRQWEEDWSTLLGVGVVVGWDAAAASQEVVPHPAWRAGVNYANERGTAALAYEHTIQPNLLLRQATANDLVTLNGTVPIPDSTFDVGATAGYQVSRAFLPTTGFGPATSQTVLADLAVGYVPKSWYVRLELRYQFSRQFAGTVQEGVAPQPDLERHAGLFTVQFGYPDSPTAGGASPFVVVPPPTANVDIMQQRAPKNEEGADADKREQDKERREERERRGGSGS